MDLFIIIRKFYGRQGISAPEPEPPPPELPSIEESLYLTIEEVVRLRIIEAEYKVLFKRDVVEVMDGEGELNKLKTTHWAGLRNDPYHNSGCIQSWGYVANCPTCRVIKYAEDLANKIAKLQQPLTEGSSGD